MPTKKKSVKPFVKVGEELGYVVTLKEKGLWPPRLHNNKDNNGNNEKPVTTPYLVIPAFIGDNGARPKPDSLVFHSRGVWIEDVTTPGIPVDVPILGKEYAIKCRVMNLGAMGSYGGLANFYFNKPSTFNVDAGTGVVLPIFGLTGFSVVQGHMVVVTCPKIWKPITPADLTGSIVVHAFDPFADMINSYYDARHDRHVGRHDFTSDFYVRDWTNSATVHDTGLEPSTNSVFYHTSDIWNRRTNAPGVFMNDQPENQDPQAGNGTDGDNYAFARISRNNDSTEETVYAHFMFAEFGTGSPYVNCSPNPDPFVVFHVGEKSKTISLKWHLHPSSSTHLCLAVQIYTDADPYLAPGLLGYTPGWPTTDMIVIYDNNKAQRNMAVWDGIVGAAFELHAMIYNAATFMRDVKLQVIMSQRTASKLMNARLSTIGVAETKSFQANTQVTLSMMLPGERRWMTLSGDGIQAKDGEVLTVFFNEVEDQKTVNGYAMSIQVVSGHSFYTSTMQAQTALFYRLAEGFHVSKAMEGYDYCHKMADQNNIKDYLKNLPRIMELLRSSLDEFSGTHFGIKDVFGTGELFRVLDSVSLKGNIQKVMSVHRCLLSRIDAWQTLVQKSKGDPASVLFTVRVQRDLYRNKIFKCEHQFHRLLKMSDEFIERFSGDSSHYISLVRELQEELKLSLQFMSTGNKILRSRLEAIQDALGHNNVAQVQKAHLGFLNAIIMAQQD